MGKYSLALSDQLNIKSLSLEPDIDIDSSTCKISQLYKAIKSGKFHLIREFEERQVDINGFIKISDSNVDYTMLHLACKDGNLQLVKMLLDNKADPNMETSRKDKPIHIATMLEHLEIVETLLKAGADVDAKLTYPVFLEYSIRLEWERNFGEEQTLLVYAVVNQNPELTEILLRYNANMRVKDNKGKELLMYILDREKKPFISNTLERFSINNIPKFLKVFSRNEIYRINENGMTLIDQIINLRKKNYALWTYVIDAGLNINMIADQRPEALLINLVAKDNQAICIKDVLRKNLASMHFARPLSFALYGGLPPKQLIVPSIITDKVLQILAHMYIRRTFDFLIHSEEVRLMDSIYEKYISIKFHVKAKCERFLKQIMDSFKSCHVFYECHEISIYDFLIKSHKDRWEVVKDNHFRRYFNSQNSFYFFIEENGMCCSEFIYYEIKNLTKRFDLLERYKELSFEKTDAWYYLPYDCMDFIKNYLDNFALIELIDAYA